MATEERQRWASRLAYFRRDFEDAMRLGPRRSATDFGRLAITARLSGDTVRSMEFADSARDLAYQQLREAERTQSIQTQAMRLSDLAVAEALLGHDEAAREHIDRAVDLVPLELDAEDGPYLLRDRATVAVLLEDPESANRDLETVLSVPSPLTVPLIRIDPLFRLLAHHPRFQALLERYEGEAH